MKISKKKAVTASRISRRRPIEAASFQTDYTSDDFRRDLESLCNEMVDEYDGGDVDDFIHDQLSDYIDRECTYYADCIQIIWASDVTDWSDADYEITSLESLAGWIIESEFYQGGYYDDVLSRLSGEDDEESEDEDE